MRTVHMIALFHEPHHDRGTFKRFTMNVPHGVNPLDYEDPDDQNGEKSEWGHPDYAGCIVEHDPDDPRQTQAATRLTDRVRKAS